MLAWLEVHKCLHACRQLREFAGGEHAGRVHKGLSLMLCKVKKVTLLLDLAPSADEGACQYESNTAVCPAYPSTAAGTCCEAAVHGDQQLWPSLMAHLGQHNNLSACLCLKITCLYLKSLTKKNVIWYISGFCFEIFCIHDNIHTAPQSTVKHCSRVNKVCRWVLTRHADCV